jgi:hypothetical protein
MLTFNLQYHKFQFIANYIQLKLELFNFKILKKILNTTISMGLYDKLIIPL